MEWKNDWKVYWMATYYALYVDGKFFRRWTQVGIAVAELEEALKKGAKSVEIKVEVE